MDVKAVYQDMSALLGDYLESLGMRPPRGPLRAMGELVRGVVWTSSVQLTNAARLRATTPARLARIVKQYSHHLASRKWDHHDWAATVLARQVCDLGPDSQNMPGFRSENDCWERIAYGPGSITLPGLEVPCG